MRNQIEKAINLAKKTGDRLIIFDSAKADSAYVVMSLEEYEKLILHKSEVRGLTEDELLDKINRDIAIWKSEQADSGSLVESEKSEAAGIFFNKDSDRSQDLKEMAAPAEEIGKIIKQKRNNAWAIPSEIKRGAEEIVENIIEEDRQYLEEINY